jgi:hypothetical protein
MFARKPPFAVLFVNAFGDAHARLSVRRAPPIDLCLELVHRESRVAVWAMKWRVHSEFTAALAPETSVSIVGNVSVRRLNGQNSRAVRTLELHEVAHSNGERPDTELLLTARAAYLVVHAG